MTDQFSWSHLVRRIRVHLYTHAKAKLLNPLSLNWRQMRCMIMCMRCSLGLSPILKYHGVFFFATLGFSFLGLSIIINCQGVFFQGRPKIYSEYNHKHVFVKMRHNIFIQCHENNIEVKKFKYMLVIDILPNFLQILLVS